MGGYGGGLGLLGGGSGLLGGGLGGYGGLGGFGGGLGGGFGGGLGGICGVPIGFGVTTTVGGLDYTDDILPGGLGYGSTLGYGAARPVGGLGGGAFNRGFGRRPYGRPF